jgi:hypothetical protein
MESKELNRLVEKTIATLDWDTILEVNKSFKHGIGDGVTAIPGIKRKPFSDNISKNDIKNELKNLLKYVIENDVDELIYGYWMIFWSNAKNSEAFLNEMMEDMDDELEGEIILNSTLEVIWSPQRTYIEYENSKESDSVNTEETVLNSLLERSLSDENFELSAKIRDLINCINSQKK